MMLRICGLIGVVATGALVGQLLFLQLRERYKQLSNLRDGLRAMVTEIDYARRPLPEAWAELSDTFDGLTSSLFSEAAAAFGQGEAVTAGRAWLKALRSVDDVTELTEEDKRILRSLAPVLGASHREDQLAHIELVDERLARQAERAREVSRRRGRLFRALGFLTGILVAVILL